MEGSNMQSKGTQLVIHTQPGPRDKNAKVVSSTPADRRKG